MKYNVEVQVPCSPTNEVVHKCVKLVLRIEVQLPQAEVQACF